MRQASRLLSVICVSLLFVVSAFMAGCSADESPDTSSTLRGPEAEAIAEAEPVTEEAKPAEADAEGPTADGPVGMAAQQAFEGDALPAGWDVQGVVGLSEAEPFEGGRALMLSRELKNVEQPTEAMSPAFAIPPGKWVVNGAMRTALVSPDNSFKGVLSIVFLDAQGNKLDETTVREDYSSDRWRVFATQVAAPKETASARYRVRMAKAHGSLWVDALHIEMAEASAQTRVHRVLFDTAQLGHLLYPDDERYVDLTVETEEELPAEARVVSYAVTDYWGAEQEAPGTVELSFVEKGKDGRYAYEARVDLASAGLEVGRYYEVRVSIPEPEGQTHRDRTTLAILPDAVTKPYTWREIPFTSRNWDNRVKEFVHLTERLGVRQVGTWGTWSYEPPYESQVVNFELARELNLATMIRTPANAIENHWKDWEKITEETLRVGARKQMEKYGPADQIMITLGNEPPEIEERAHEAVAAYKALYETYKSVAPDVTVVGTSIGPSEEYFAAGMGEYCDVYDFHTYNDVSGIRRIFEQYDDLFETYGNPRPIWSTEIGLNSEGVPRHAVAGDMIRKISTFFACGGANFSWFGLLYPDPNNKISGSGSDAHNIFYCKYNCYSPKMDAISYYNMINGLCIKKFVAEQMIGDVMTMLFRDEDGRCLVVMWTDQAAQDLYLPMPGVSAVKQTLIDGRIAALDAGGNGLTLRVSSDPLLLEFEGPDMVLPDTLGEPAVMVQALPEEMVKGQPGDLTFTLAEGVSVDELDLIVPPFWEVVGKELMTDRGGANIAHFTVKPPRETQARAGVLHLTHRASQAPSGWLSLQVPVSGTTAAQLLPRPIDETGKAGVRIAISNLADTDQQVAWDVSLGESFRMADGRIMESSTGKPAEAYFGAAVEGVTTVPAGQTVNVDVPLENIDPITSYFVHASVTDPEGRAIHLQRPMGGFIGAPRTGGTITLDGKLDEADWDRCTVIDIDKPEQYLALKKLDPGPWGGPEDVSAKVRLLWDETNLYLGFDITDDILEQNQHGANMWKQDGVQFLINPGRGAGVEQGKYDISMGVGTEGPQVFVHYSANPAVPAGLTDAITYAQHETGQGGNRTAEVAIPWAWLPPFEPGEGANLGMCIVINEDDKPVRNCYMNWFGDINIKSVRANGDIILVTID